MTYKTKYEGEWEREKRKRVKVKCPETVYIAARHFSFLPQNGQKMTVINEFQRLLFFSADMRRRDLPLLHHRDVHQDAGHGHLRGGMLPLGDVEQAGLLHCGGRVRINTIHWNSCLI